MYFKAYLQNLATLLDIMGKSKEISQDLRKKLVDHKSASSVGAISKRLKVPHSYVQTIVRKYSGAEKYIVSHQLCKFSHLKR